MLTPKPYETVTAAATWSNEANQKSVFHLSRQQTIEIIECRNYRYFIKVIITIHLRKTHNYVTGYNNTIHMFN